jgi:hypothetical protein
MKRKLLYGLGAFLALVIGLLLWVVLVGNKRSPAQTVALSQGGVDYKVTYCRPFKKGRLIFGENDAGAVVPFGKYWRLGANAATEITFSKKVSFSGKPVEAGRYRMYAVPGAKTWRVVLNSELDKWGAREADHAKDVLTVEVPADAAAAEAEQFTISLTGEGAGTRMDFVWDKTAVHVPIAAL